jgi:hypothetical protein
VRRKKTRFIIALLSLLFLTDLISCASDKALLPVKNSLPQDDLAYYCDTFDKMREDLWDRAGYLYREEQQQNYKQADMSFESGKLIIRTKTGSFSKGGLGSRYTLRGDFDIQLDCRMDFIRGLSGMDQLFVIGVFDTSKKIGENNTVSIALSMKDGSDRGFLFSKCIINGRRQGGSSKNFGNFNGTFRFLRNGQYISTLYKLNRTAEWILLNTFYATDNDMMVGFALLNFFDYRGSIQAKQSISVELGGFKITAAQEIIEEEI